ncbi:YhdP family protein [Aquabacterium sp. OR-4]|uniref:YhdP family protein n=1 Tax=Aquabacterium sp. OR-4 TaxID=2978127 RepID=UPI0028C67747|nr:YhdP family protein [Aquabacterium sp. OR-4]MDT7834054.1 YhdP family protein [Aquabacterium sp. OR-4]
MSFTSLAARSGTALWRLLGRIWRLAFGALLLLASLAVVAWLTLHWGILPRIDEWRPRVEREASRAIGAPVSIGRITVRSGSWVPAFELSDVVLRDARGREALRLPRVAAALSVPSLLGLHLRFDQLLIDGARLEVRRDARGRWHVGGLDVEGGSGATLDGSASADWFFEQHEFVIRGGELRWVDELRAAPPLALADVQLVLRNRGLRHAMRLDATPPPDWGQRFTLIAQARQPLLTGSGLLRTGFTRAGDWRRWKGSLFAHLPHADVSQLRRHVDLPMDLTQGHGALRAWLDWDQAQPRAATVDVALADVSLRLGAGLEPLAFQRISGRLSADRDEAGLRVAASGLAFDTADGHRWAPSTLALRVQQRQTLAAPPAAGAASAAAPAAAAPVTGGELSADRLDLAPLAELAERLPLGRSVRELLQQLSPQGTVQQLHARWSGPLDAPASYQVRAAVRGMAIAAASAPGPDGVGRPGWRGADLDFVAGESGGQATLTLKQGALEFPGVFSQAVVPLNSFSAQLQWRIAAAATPEAAPRIELKLDKVRFANDDAQGEASATWRTGSGPDFAKGGRLPGVLELSGRLTSARATAVARYLPTGIGPDTRAWVTRAVEGGELHNVSFRVKGDLWDFPFVNRRDGEFRIAGELRNVTLAPVPPGPGETWPAFGQVSGELVFERNSMQFQKTRGRLWGVELTDVQGRIRDLSPQAVLELEGVARGPASDLLRYVATTPIGGWIDDALAPTTASGQAELRLALNIPLEHSVDTVLRGSVLLPGNDVRLRTDLPLLAQARGRVDFTHRGVQVPGLQAQALGGELQIDGGTQADGSLRLGATGTASLDGLRRATELGAVARAATQWQGRVQGQAPYRLQVQVQRGQTELQLSSTLQGVSIDLPPPLRKQAGETMALRLSTTPQPEPRGAAAAAPAPAQTQAQTQTQGQGAAASRDLLRLELGPLQATLLRDLSGPEPQLLRSAWAWAAPLPEPAAGGRATLVLPALDLDAWRALWAPGAPLAASAAVAGSSAGLATLLPHSIRLQTPELLAEGRRLTGLTLDLQRMGQPGEEGWRAQVAADQTSGTVEWRDARGSLSAGRIKARLARLSVPPSEADGMAGLLDRVPASVPALDIDIANFELSGKALGHLAVEAVNRGAPGADGAPRAQWRLDRLVLDNPDARLSASGQWQAVPGDAARRRMALDFKLDIADGGALLERLGFGRVVRGAKGRLQGTLGWDGSPLALHLPTLEGGFQVALEGGQFLKADAGAGRLLGVLNLQALPRRLLLDFSDVFAEGFGFDDVGGEVRVRRGVAETHNLRMRGLQAAVLMEGSADIARATQDLHVVVVPELNTASASLAYVAVNPAIGLGAFLGQWLLREPLRQASLREFRISGAWDDPKVERLERRFLEPAAAGATAPAAAASGAGR